MSQVNQEKKVISSQEFQRQLGSEALNLIYRQLVPLEKVFDEAMYKVKSRFTIEQLKSQIYKEKSLRALFYF
jgi:hypothetical protein